MFKKDRRGIELKKPNAFIPFLNERTSTGRLNKILVSSKDIFKLTNSSTLNKKIGSSDSPKVFEGSSHFTSFKNAKERSSSNKNKSLDLILSQQNMSRASLEHESRAHRQPGICHLPSRALILKRGYPSTTFTQKCSTSN